MLFLSVLALLPAVMLLQIAWADVIGLEARFAHIGEWAFACSEAAVETTLTGARAEVILELKPGATASWRWPIQTPYGEFQSALTVTGGGVPEVRSVCTYLSTVATTRAHLQSLGGTSAQVVKGSWKQCGVRSPCDD